MFRIKFQISSALLVMLASFFPAMSMAMAIDPGLSIVGTTILDSDDPDLGIDNSWSTFLYSTIGGSTSGSVVNVSLTDTGDGFGHTASLAGTNDNVSTLGADYSITASNSTADTYSLIFGITFAHSTDSDAGDLDARGRSRLQVNEAGAVIADSELYSRLTSESGDDYAATHPTWTDQIDDETSNTDLGTNGELVSFGETRYFAEVLLAGGIFDLEAEFTLDGRIFDDGASYNMASSMFVFLDSFENLTNPGGPVDPPPTGLSEPSSLIMLLTGFAAISIRRKRQR